MTLMEMAIAVGLGSIVLTGVALLFVFGMRSFVALGNYTEMNTNSRRSMDLMLREIRSSTHVLASQSNSTAVWLEIANSNATPATINTFTWTPSTGLLTWDKTGQATMTLLQGCDSWTFAYFISTPNRTNGVFYATTDPAQCKLINMTWTCSRTNVYKKFNTESVVTAEVVLRNKQ